MSGTNASYKFGFAAVAPLVRVRDLEMHFDIRRGLFGAPKAKVRAVDGVSFDIAQSEVLALVGESGCGKTTVGRCLLMLLKPTAGSVEFAGQNLADLDRHALRQLRPGMQIIFQDPFGSLNPRMTVAQMLHEPLRMHKLVSEKVIRRRIDETLELVRLPSEYRDRYPHEFSGGQRQRLSIARALVHKPKFIVCDEAVSALDVSVQAEIINLLTDLQRDLGLSYLFISHDLNVVRYLADRVAVMYLGKIVELDATRELFRAPKHPYTLLSANPVPNPSIKSQMIMLEGDVPSPIDVPDGCAFHQRCPKAFGRCRFDVPQPMRLVGSEGATPTIVRCHLYEETAAQMEFAKS